MELRDAVLRLRRDGAFIAVPCSYEIWAPSETLSSVFSYLCMNRGQLRFVASKNSRTCSCSGVSPREDHELRSAWIGPSFPLDLTKLPLRAKRFHSNIRASSAEVGYSTKVPFMNLEDRAALGANVERVLSNEKDAARAPIP
ncbi:hypothetical protein C8R46DRAFT_1104035 [Mycena filopes]|nr:hypothetical protein C8R46DRAFT_1104035 [Mycena filopes]